MRKYFLVGDAGDHHHGLGDLQRSSEMEMPVRCRWKGVVTMFKSGPGPRHLLIVVKSLSVEMLSDTRDLRDSRLGGLMQWSPMRVLS